MIALENMDSFTGSQSCITFNCTLPSNVKPDRLSLSLKRYSTINCKPFYNDQHVSIWIHLNLSRYQRLLSLGRIFIISAAVFSCPESGPSDKHLLHWGKIWGSEDSTFSCAPEGAYLWIPPTAPPMTQRSQLLHCMTGNTEYQGTRFYADFFTRGSQAVFTTIAMNGSALNIQAYDHW